MRPWGCGGPWLAGWVALATACAPDRPRPPRHEGPAPEDGLGVEVESEEWAPDPNDPLPALAVPDPSVRIHARTPDPHPIAAANHADQEYASDAPVRARRYVYRVRMAVPAGAGTGRVRVTVPAAELHVDVSDDRLRARFVGTGWPIAPGSEVRLRRDRPGVYLFDDRGGRPLEPGRLAAWFEGGPVTRRGPPLYIYGTHGFPRGGRPEEDDRKGELVCALLAELNGEARDSVVRRCELGAPNLWRMGFWRGQQTAGVPLELPRSALRADERGPPRDLVAPRESRPFLEPEALRRLDGGGAPADAPPEGAPPEGLRVDNETADRAIVAVEGVAIGWVDAGASGLFVGLDPGTYEVGTIRPLGAVVQRGRPVRVPGVHRVCDGRCPRR
ncbi:MAG: hypothetical protein KF729_32905 [Sandaracinaceae bacterium]|nr:hypothetical protein [Sandaracinaceae bacterium]